MLTFVESLILLLACVRHGLCTVVSIDLIFDLERAQSRLIAVRVREIWVSRLGAPEETRKSCEVWSADRDPRLCALQQQYGVRVVQAFLTAEPELLLVIVQGFRPEVAIIVSFLRTLIDGQVGYFAHVLWYGGGILDRTLWSR